MTFVCLRFRTPGPRSRSKFFKGMARVHDGEEAYGRTRRRLGSDTRRRRGGNIAVITNAGTPVARIAIPLGASASFCKRSRRGCALSSRPFTFLSVCVCVRECV
jgi:hypothetical protein